MRVNVYAPLRMARAFLDQVRASAAQAGKPITTAVIAPADSAHALANYIEGLSIDKAGRFYSSRTGQEVPW